MFIPQQGFPEGEGISATVEQLQQEQQCQKKKQPGKQEGKKS